VPSGDQLPATTSEHGQRWGARSRRRHIAAWQKPPRAATLLPCAHGTRKGLHRDQSTAPRKTEMTLHDRAHSASGADSAARARKVTVGRAASSEAAASLRSEWRIAAVWSCCVAQRHSASCSPRRVHANPLTLSLCRKTRTGKHRELALRFQRICAGRVRCALPQARPPRRTSHSASLCCSLDEFTGPHHQGSRRTQARRNLPASNRPSQGTRCRRAS